jgi:hypothetical protein
MAPPPLAAPPPPPASPPVAKPSTSQASAIPNADIRPTPNAGVEPRVALGWSLVLGGSAGLAGIGTYWFRRLLPTMR